MSAELPENNPFLLRCELFFELIVAGVDNKFIYMSHAFTLQHAILTGFLRICMRLANSVMNVF